MTVVKTDGSVTKVKNIFSSEQKRNIPDFSVRMSICVCALCSARNRDVSFLLEAKNLKSPLEG